MRYFIVTYMQKPDGRYNETINLDSKVRNRDLQTATVILDYMDRKIVKSRFQDELGTEKADFDTLHKFYNGHYPDIIGKLEAKYKAIEEIAEEVIAAAKGETVKDDVAES